jgi:hypothetical protein
MVSKKGVIKMTGLNKKTKNNIFKIAVVMVIIVASVLAFTSCIYIPIRVNTVHGSGNIVSETREIKDFEKVSLEGIGNLIIEQGDKESITIEAEDNIIPKIETTVRNGILVIDYKRPYFNIIPTKDIKFHLKVKNLSSINLSGAGNVECDKFETDKLKINTSGAGKIKFNVTAIDFEVDISGAGSAELSGKVEEQKIDISGAGNYQAKDLESKNCTISISGIGSATVNATENLDITISGVGNVNYIGSPKINQEINGPGRIKNISE